MEKDEILNSFFALVFTLQVCLEASQVSESSGRDWKSDT